MYEELWLKSGIILGVYCMISLYSSLYLMSYMIEKRQWNRYLLETKQHQKFKEFIRRKNG